MSPAAVADVVVQTSNVPSRCDGGCGLMIREAEDHLSWCPGRDTFKPKQITWKRRRSGDRLTYNYSHPDGHSWARIERITAADRRWADKPPPLWARYVAHYFTSQVLNSTNHYFETLAEAKDRMGRIMEPWL